MRGIQSKLLNRHGFRHAFATRAGGVSVPPYDTLNLGFHLGDGHDAVRENRTRFATAIGVAADRLFEQRQVHGATAREVASSDVQAAFADLEGDALIARSEGLGVAARTADCVPVLLAHPPSGHVAAVHAGWRGAVAGVVLEAVRGLSHDPVELVAAVGPHIRLDAFEIGEDVAQQLEQAARGRDVVRRGDGKPHGDLAALVSAHLQHAGLSSDAIDDVGGCTFSEPARFFSHRREAGNTGRHLSAIVARGPA